MLSVYQPIIATITGLSRNTLTTYEVSLDGDVIFTGKTMTDGDGTAQVRLDALLRDYRPDLSPKWEQVALPMWGLGQLTPADFTHVGGDAVPPLDGLTYKRVSILVESRALWRESIFGGYIVPWEMLTLDEDLPVGNLARAGGCTVVPRVPYSASTDIFFGAAIYSKEERCIITTPNGEVEQLLVDKGIFSFQWPASEYMSYLQEQGDAIFYITVDDEHAEPLMKVDGCPAPYYIQWRLPNFGLASWPFEGNVRMSGSLAGQEIRTGDDEERVISMEGRTLYNLNSGYVTRAEWDYLQTMQYAKEVVLVDVYKGNSIPCTITQATWETAGNVRHSSRNFAIQLQQRNFTTI